MNKAKQLSKEDGKKFLRQSFERQQAVLAANLKHSESIAHDGVMGDVNEEHFIDLLRQYLPQRYAIDSAIVIDSNGALSDQIDIVIYDNQYTPTLLDQKSHKYVPAEAVYAVFEVKPTINKGYLEYAGEKAESVRILERTSVPIVHAGGIFPARPLFNIVAGIVATDVEWVEGFTSSAFIANYASLTGNQVLNCGLAVSGGCFDTFDSDLQAGPINNSLAYFIFRLSQKLQSLGTVPAIDWNKYAEVMHDNDA
ncbi:MAG: hypothetical protein PHZ17_09405 [Sulfurovum sp.]|nr:hypothetical protein [Candidatus Gracilibacteria bacterium]MDD3603511.1 hypothetical protein [Sulfurovum sp.]